MDMKISGVNSVTANLLTSSERNVHVYGLCTTAWYGVNTLPGWSYKITFWHRHAPVVMPADIVTVELGCTYVYIDDCGHIRRDKKGFAMATNRLVLMCPKTREGLYMQGYDPLTLAKGYVNRYMMPTTWAYDDYFVKHT